ncbi:hypothetical protein [Bradyrhizobium sp. DOA1]|uniref:hypothetical protein n=1 Tax=Bradyrhizobium sp. DOA1 TaxID=1126616 RepID=UPI0007C71F97|nr:hypothetical protein [Bradyrhizobium sp. DOA1]
MLDLRVVTTSTAMLIAMMAVALAEPVKDKAPVAGQSATEARPIRVVLPAPWEPATRSQGEMTNASK